VWSEPTHSGILLRVRILNLQLVMAKFIFVSNKIDIKTWYRISMLVWMVYSRLSTNLIFLKDPFTQICIKEFIELQPYICEVRELAPREFGRLRS
jgi:hypothetical protein